MISRMNETLITQIISLALALLATGNVYGQNLKGTVRDSSDGNALPGVIVKVKGEEGKTLGYATTLKDGSFIIAKPAKASEIVFSMLGYKEASFKAPFQDNYDIRLEASREHIKEAVVQARKVVMSGDTVKYNVKALISRDDAVLGDVLKRLPGIELTPSGHLRVDGKDLGKFYVNGKDFLDYNYNLATKNLNVNAVKKVEVIRNHQAIKMLEGLEESDKAAVNIILEDGYKGKINWRGSGSIGGAADKPYVPWAVDLSAIDLSDGMANLLVGDYDSEGKALKENTFNFYQLADGNRRQVKGHILASPVKAPLENKRSLFNNSLDTRAVNTVALSPTSTFMSVVSFASDRRESEMAQISTYHNSGYDDQTLGRTEKREEKGWKFTGSLTYRNNSEKCFVNERLFADFGNSSGYSEVSGDISRSQRTENRRWDIDNDLTARLKTSSGKAFSISSYTQFTRFDESLDLLGQDTRQDIASTAFFEDLLLNGIDKAGKRWTWSVEPELKWALYKRNSSLEGIPDDSAPGLKDDNSKASHLTAGMKGDISWKNGGLRLYMEGSVIYNHIRFKGYASDKIIPDFSAGAKYESGRFEAVIEGGVKTEKPDIQALGAALILSDYYSISRGRESLLFLPSRYVSGLLMFRSPVEGWQASLMSRYSYSKACLNGRDILEDYVVSYVTNETVGNRTLIYQADLTKALFAINGKMTFTLSGVTTMSTFRQNGVTTDYSSKTLEPGFDISISPIRFWNIKADGSYSLYDMAVGQSRTSHTGNLRVRMTNSLYPSESITLGLGTDYYYNSSIGKDAFFADLFLTWKFRNGLRLKAQLNNILNMKEYSYVSLSPLLDNSFSYKIRPLTALIGFDWTF